MRHSLQAAAIAALAALTAPAFTACDDDHVSNFAEIIIGGTTKADSTTRYNGIFASHMYLPTGADLGASDTIDVDYIKATGSVGGDTIVMYNVKFSSMMPVTLAAIRFAQVGRYNTTGTLATLTQRTDSVTPDYYVPLTGWQPYADRKISGLTGQIKGDSLILSMTCGTFPLEFRGIVKK